MPWTGPQFAERHNHGLSGGRAEHAAHIANAVLKSGVPEGESIAIANKWAQHHRAMGGMTPRFDDGGATSSLGYLTPSSSTENPVSSNLIQRYSGLSNEKLQELSAASGNSTQGKIAAAVLKQRQMMPNTTQQSQQTGNQLQTATIQPQTQQTQQTQQPQQQQGQTNQIQTFNPQALATEFSGGMQPNTSAKGGHLAAGGDPMGVSMSSASPWWTRREATSDSGLLSGSTFGRADSVKGAAPSGSYVLPAEMIAGLGEGNGLAGARLVQQMTSTGPYGTALPRMTHGRGPPSPPHVQAVTSAKGGGVQQSPTEHTPVALSHGEFNLSPRDCIVLVSNMVHPKGGKPPVPLKYAHKVLDEWVKIEHRNHAKVVDKLAKQGPVT